MIKKLKFSKTLWIKTGMIILINLELRLIKTIINYFRTLHWWLNEKKIMICYENEIKMMIFGDFLTVLFPLIDSNGKLLNS